MSDDLFGPEPLHPDLEPYVQDSGFIGKVIRFPLIVSVPYYVELNKQLNRRYELLIEKVEEAKGNGDWLSFVFLHERPFRLDALLDAVNEGMSGEVYNKVLAHAWVDSENPGVNLDTWVDLFTSPEVDGSQLMDEEERADFLDLPETLTVYRGARPEYRRGLSWTTDLKTARWFANRWGKGLPVWRMTVQIENVIAHFTGRGEREVIIHPDAWVEPERVTDE